MLTARQMRTHLQHYRYNRDLYTGRRRSVPLGLICDLARLDVRAVKSFIADVADDPVWIGARGLAALSHVIEQIESGEVRVLIKGRRSEVEYVRKPARPPIQDRLTRFEDHREWARCRTCQGDHWQAVEVHGTLHYACRACWPAANLAAIGGRKVERMAAMREP